MLGRAVEILERLVAFPSVSGASTHGILAACSAQKLSGSAKDLAYTCV